MGEATDSPVRSEIGITLHDRATRGLPLTPEEQKTLDEWYAEMDAEEVAMLARHQTPSHLETVRQQVDEAMARVLDASQRLQELITETDRLRNAIAEVERRLAGGSALARESF